MPMGRMSKIFSKIPHRGVCGQVSPVRFFRCDFYARGVCPILTPVEFLAQVFVRWVFIA